MDRPVIKGFSSTSGATEPSLTLMKGYWDLGRAEVIHAYGATETAPVVTANLIKPELEILSAEQQWDHKKKQGLPMPGIDFKVVNENGNLKAAENGSLP